MQHLCMSDHVLEILFHSFELLFLLHEQFKEKSPYFDYVEFCYDKPSCAYIASYEL